MSSYRVKLRRGTTAETSVFTGEVGEVTVDTTKKTLVVHDGTTRGGHPLPRDTDVKTDLNQLTDNYGLLQSYVDGFTGSTEVYAITVAPDSSGNNNVFYITGLENPHIVLTPGNRYVFDVSDSSNTGHPLYFTADDGVTNYTTNVSRIGTEGTAGAKVIFIIPADVPALKYYCSVHGLSMGNQISSVLNTQSSGGGSSSLASFDISPALPTGETSWNLATDGDLSITEAGNWTFTATADGTVDLSMKGAGGGYGKDTNALGGTGGLTSGKIAVTAGDVFKVTVGSKGVQSGGAGAYGGGGAGGNLTLPGSGGGYSGIFEGTEQQSKSILIAGGGGGGHGWDAGSATGNGGSGGGTDGLAGTAGSSGGGATQISGGAGAGNGTSGTPLTGGTGGTRSTNQGSGGGGGGGYFGGGGGAAGSYNGNQNGTPGGGGSGYIGGTSNFAVTDGVTTAGSGSTTEVDGTFSMVGQVAATEETPTVTTPTVIIDTSETIFHLTTDGAAGVNTEFADSSSTAATVTAGGSSVQLSTFSPYRHGGYSTYFDGTGDHITIPNNSGTPFDFGTDNFTIEGWFYLTTSGSWTSYWGISQGGGPAQKINLYDSSGDGTLDIDVDGSVVFSSSAVLTDLQNKWAHIALVREGTGANQTKLYVNGSVVGQGTVSTNFSGFTQPFIIGHNGELYSGAFNGYISDFRIVSSAVYTEAFTPPTERLTAISGTELLTCHLPYIADGSTNSNTITINGNTKTEPFSPYDRVGYNEDLHGGSVYFDQTGVSHATVSRLQVGSASPDYDLSGGGTVEGWVYINSYGNDSFPNENRPIWCFYNTSYNGVTKYYSLCVDHNGYLAIKKDYNSHVMNISTTKIPLNVWVHVAFTTTGTNGTNKFYVNGKDVTSSFAGDTTLGGYFPASTGNNDYELWVGAIKYAYNGKDYIAGMDGYISDLRVFKGDVLYSGDFTPPTETLTAVTDTQVLIGHNVSDGDTEFTDGSSSGRTITKYDTPVGSSLGPATGMTSILFDGINDYLTLPASTDFDFGTGDFTIEFWIYLTNANAGRIITNRRTAAAANGTWAVNMSTTGISFTEVISGEPGPTVANLSSVENQWCHVAVVRDNGVTTIYRDGINVVSAAQSTNFTNSSYPLYIMTSPSETWSAGYLSNVRIVKGTAIYSSSTGNRFTPPTAPLESTDTAAHIKGVEGHIIDKSQSDNKLTLVGNTTASTSESKYAGSSIYFDGTGDYITLSPEDSFQFGTEDFTVELWINYTNSPSASFFFADARNSSQTTNWAFYRTAATELSWYNGTSEIKVSNFHTPATWTHIAYTRSGTTGKLFINGVQSASGTDNTNYSVAPSLSYIGTRYSLDERLIGYIEDFRITKGLARYTEDFTVPGESLDLYTETGATTEETPTVTTPTVISDSSETFFHLTTDGEAGVNSSFVDSSSNAATITAGGTPQLNTFSPYRHGGYSTYFDGSGDYLSMPSVEGYKFGTGDFTIEGWVYFNTLNDSVWQTVIDCWQGTNNYNWLLVFKADTLAFAAGNNGAYSASNNHQVAISPLSAGNWYHFAATRESGSLRFFINGTQQGSTLSSTANISDNIPVYIGTNQDGGQQPFNGHLSDIRVVKGTAVYTADFTPPTERLTAITGTELLTCHLPYIVDESTNNNAITTNGDVSVEPLSPYDHIGYIEGTHGGSVYFDGTGDFLDVTNGFPAVGTGDYTIEFWMYRTSDTSNSVAVIDTRESNPNNPAIYIRPNDEVYYFANNGVQIQSTTQTKINQWYHVALSRSSGVSKLFIDGKQEGSSYNDSTSFTQDTLFVGDGYYVSTYDFTGYISDLRVVSSAVYTADFTPPTAPLESTGTAVHIKGVEGHIIDKAQSDNKLTLVGNTTASTAQTKYASSSIYFDGTGDSISTSSSSLLSMGSGDYTVELWAYFNSLPTVGAGWHMIFSARDGSNNGVAFYIDGPTPHVELYTGSLVATGTTTLSTGQWYHLAYVRNNGTGKVYINGTEDVSYSYPTSVGDVAVHIAGQGTQYANMYIEDFRITKGLARYTENFTVPDAALESPQTTGGGAYIVATGGTITTDGNYKYHTFTGDGTFSVTGLGTNNTIDVLAVGGGGGGGGSSDSNSGGGGAGGYLEGSITAEVQSYDIVIGQGGTGGVADVGTSGGDTTISVLNATALGGGYGGGGARSLQKAASQGGSGGGGGGFPNDMSGGAGIQGDSGGLTGYGNAGGSIGSYSSDGGGGAGQAGGTNANSAGGDGRQWLDGNYYAGGGSGGAGNLAGGLGGGGAGSNGSGNGANATANTGGGGGGSYASGSSSSSTGGNGGSGVVIFRYPYQGTVTETPPASTPGDWNFDEAAGTDINSYSTWSAFSLPQLSGSPSWTFNGSALVVDLGGEYDVGISTPMNVTSGTTYTITINLSQNSVSRSGIMIGTSAGDQTYANALGGEITSSGEHVRTWTATTTGTVYFLYRSVAASVTSGTMTIDNITISPWE